MSIVKLLREGGQESYIYKGEARVMPDLVDYKLFRPFSYANAADLFSMGKFILRVRFWVQR